MFRFSNIPEPNMKTPRWIENAAAEIVRTKFKPAFLAAELEAILVKHALKRRARR